jgi:hypothetical protein
MKLRVRLWLCLGLLCSIVVHTTQAEEGSKPVAGVSGSLTLNKSNYKLAHGMAYETDVGGETGVAVLLSDRKLPTEKIQATLKQNKGRDDSLSLEQTYLLLHLEKSGKVRSYRASNSMTTLSQSGEEVTREITFADNHAAGSAKVASKDDAIFKYGFDVQFDLVIGAAAAAPPKKPSAGPVKPTVTGDFLGNGKPAKLAFISAHTGEAFDDQPVVVVVMTEKDHSKDPKPDFKAGFGEYGSALVVKFLPEGKIIGCEVVHAAHGKMPFSTSGTLQAPEFELEEGSVSGELLTDGEQEFFGKTWRVNLKFAAPYQAPAAKPKVAEKPRNQPAAPTKTKPAKTKPATDEDDDDDDAHDDEEQGTPAVAGDELNVKDLALPKDASDIVYKKIVHNISFNSATAVQPLAEEISKKLAAQGWKTDKSGDLVTPKSAILKRTRGKASLTIFVKPGDKGSKVTLMTEGLNWDGK